MSRICDNIIKNKMYLLWIRKRLEKLNFQQQLLIKNPTVHPYKDNESCIKMLESDKYARRTKHIHIEHHSIKHLKETGITNVKYCPSKGMIADILSKTVPKHEFQKHRSNLSLRSSSSSKIKKELV